MKKLTKLPYNLDRCCHSFSETHVAITNTKFKYANKKPKCNLYKIDWGLNQPAKLAVNIRMNEKIHSRSRLSLSLSLSLAQSVEDYSCFKLCKKEEKEIDSKEYYEAN